MLAHIIAFFSFSPSSLLLSTQSHPPCLSVRPLTVSCGQYDKEGKKGNEGERQKKKNLHLYFYVWRKLFLSRFFLAYRMSYKVLHHLDSRCQWIRERAFGLRKYPIWRVVEARGLNILVLDVLKGTPFHPLNSYPVLFLKRFTNSTSSGASTQVGLCHRPAPIWRQHSHRHRGGPL